MEMESFSMPVDSQNFFRAAAAECFSDPSAELSWQSDVQITNIRQNPEQLTLTVDIVVMLSEERPKLPSRSAAAPCLLDALVTDSYFQGLQDVTWREPKATLLGIPMTHAVALIGMLSGTAVAAAVLLTAFFTIRTRRHRRRVQKVASAGTESSASSHSSGLIHPSAPTNQSESAPLA